MDESLGFNTYDYGARFYDPALGRWFTPDALAKKYYDQSVYIYTLNNPILFINPDGNQVEMCCEKLIEWANEYRKGAWEVAGNLVSGIAASSYNTVKSASNAVSNVVNAYESGGAGAAAKEYINQVYETSGAKSAVETVKVAADGDPQAICKTVVNVVAIAATRKFSQNKSTVKTSNNSVSSTVVTEKTISDALKNSNMKTVQSDVSLPVIQNYVKRIKAEETPPPIKVDNGVIIDGNHRYVSGAVAGKLLAQKPSVLPRSMRPLVKPISEIKINPNDFGNR